ncbi:9553_t:CDS:2 [Rhizophagus irregularis]|nr:9553_t:CDS:2 [Rhizophagus irregularis]
MYNHHPTYARYDVNIILCLCCFRSTTPLFKDTISEEEVQAKNKAMEHHNEEVFAPLHNTKPK